MKLIDLLTAMQEPNPSGYVAIFAEDGAFQGYIEGYANGLLTSLSSATLKMKVVRISLTTKTIFPMLKITIRECKEG